MKVNNQQIVFVAGMHGDERSPVFALKKAEIPYVLGNPKAFDKNVRFIDVDLNAAFGSKRKTYESQRARVLLEKIPKRNRVVDFHSTSGKTPPFVIIVDKKQIPFAMKMGLQRIVFMRYSSKQGHALIDFRDGVSIEVGTHGTKQSEKTTLRVVKNLSSKKTSKHIFYEVYGIINKPGKYRNFVKHKDGFYPVLAGERSYDFYGLKARRMKVKLSDFSKLL